MAFPPIISIISRPKLLASAAYHGMGDGLRQLLTDLDLS